MKQKAVVALGTFDGVHLGHKKLIKAAAAYAKKNKLPCIVTTFDPHPQQFIVPERGLKLLTTLAERKVLLKALGADKVAVFKFNEKLRRANYEAFVTKYLMVKLKAAVVFVGYDYAFGRGREGRVRELRLLGKKYGFAVKMVKPFKCDGETVKSSVIRRLLSEGNFNKAFRFLGHPYIISGKVVRGTGRGKKLGFPTANLSVDRHKLIPRHGVYIAAVNGKKGLVNIGARPTFGAGDTEIEAFILKFHGNLYDKEISAALCIKIRDELQFTDALQLKAQIRKDVDKCARSVL